MKKVNHHAVICIIMPKEKSFLKYVMCNIYDESYSLRIAHHHFNFFGGNAKLDTSPLGTLKRELNEEICGSSKAKENLKDIIGPFNVSKIIFSKKINKKLIFYKDRKLFMNAVLSNAKGIKDFITIIKGDKIGKNEDLIFLDSVFISKIDPNLFHKIALKLKNNYRLVNEGNVKVLTIEELRKGTVRGIWGRDLIFNYLFDEDIPCYDWVKIIPIVGKPRDSYKEYKTDFIYEKNPEK